MSVPTYFWTTAILSILDCQDHSQGKPYSLTIIVECVTLCALKCVDAASLRIYHGSLNRYTATPLEEPLRILPYINRYLVSVFYVFGFSDNVNSTETVQMLSAYLSTDNANVLLLDWSEEASVGELGPIMTYIFKSVPNAKFVGERFGGALLTLLENGLNEDRVHIVGHSLGAQVAGYACQYTRNNKRTIARLTALDPAGPLFEGAINMGVLNSSLVVYLDVLHTNPGFYGMKHSIGTVDFWANCDSQPQPGCPSPLSAPYSFCSHQRSYELFSEAVRYPNAFPAVKCDNCFSWQHQNDYSQVIFLGDLVDTRARGNYCFSTNDRYPFSKGPNGLKPNTRNY